MWIKICGNTNLADVQMVADAGADATGFVFAPSPRRVTAGHIAGMMPDLPVDLTKIGVFDTQNFEEITDALQSAGLHGVQLHGELDFSLAEKLRNQFGSSFFLIQTLHWNLNSDPARIEERLHNELRAIARHRHIDAVLLDTRTATGSGGTGKVLDWEHAGEILADQAGKMRIILAGGLTPENVAEAIRTLRPWGVDVSSGVERGPGTKDPARVRAFIAAARTAFAAIENHQINGVPTS